MPTSKPESSDWVPVGECGCANDKLSSSRRLKLAVFGLDGAGFSVMGPFLESGLMPNVSKLVKRGVHGDLESTMHPLTPLAWSSFLSGQNPGRHGIYDFFARIEDSYKFRLVTSSERSGADFIDLLNDSGLRVVCFNIPMTYPPKKVDGALVSGMGTPNLHTEFTYPPELRDELLRKFPDYIISPKYDRGRDVIPPSLISMTKTHTDAVSYLLDKYDPDVLVMVYQATDVAQHLFWHDFYSGDENSGEEQFPNLIPEIYNLADEGIGRILAEIGHDVPSLIVSDHGAQPLNLVVGLNRLLADKGYLVFYPPGAAPSGSKRKILNAIARRVGLLLQTTLPKSLKENIKKMIPGLSKKMLQLWHVPDMRAVDFEKTKAYAVGSYGGIYLNLKGREPAGIINPGAEYEELRDELTNVLNEWIAPDGKKVVERVYKREELYSGPQLEKAADLVVHLAEGRFTKTTFAPEKEELYEESTYQMFSHRHQSIHAMQGICIASGHPFAAADEALTIEGARIIDVAPTILHAVGVEIPSDMDGVLLEKLFDPDWLRENPPKIGGEITGVTGKSGKKLTPEEEEKLKTELQGLGYIQ